MTTALRAILLVLGVASAWYGIHTLLGFPTTDLISVVVWFAAAILVHDAVFAPLVAAAGVGARHLLPVTWWAPAACGAVCTVALLAVSVPVIGRRHARPVNPTVLDRPYQAGLIAAILLIWLLVALVVVANRIRLRRITSAALSDSAATDSD
ncbi:hypothetical protein [Nocardia sp. alder85J]|uniref:hypothetical protein n=1 Tax=Nocardia sp. alder85J TaxID=2862949 RepID=UPI001CD7B61E|nr:hypothetical protein [Nocardia sp. alder85J]MCX4094720.1 hypothetical protein [Nocardia sp. alder85J]